MARFGRRALDLSGVRRARRGAEWGRRRYAGSSAEHLWNRLNALDFIGAGILFAATLLLCFIPFLIVADALAGRSFTETVARHTGLNQQASADLDHLFAPAATTNHAVSGSASAVFFVLGGIAAATALQQLYERVFELDSRGLKDVWRRLIWLAWFFGTGVLSGWLGPQLRHAVGPVLLEIVGLVWATAYWWVTLWILVGGRISWRQLFPSAFATGLFYVGMLIVFSLFFSNMIISEDNEYGPIGVVFAIMTFLIAVGVVIILGAVVGLVWQERDLSLGRALRRLRRAR
jgi:membrane protein